MCIQACWKGGTGRKKKSKQTRWPSTRCVSHAHRCVTRALKMNRISAAEDEADKPVSQKLDRSDAVSTFDVGSAFSQDGSLLLSHQSSSFGAAIGMSEGGSLAESSFPTAGEPPASNVEALAVLEEMVRETEALRDILAAGKGGEEDASAVAQWHEGCTLISGVFRETPRPLTESVH